MKIFKMVVVFTGMAGVAFAQVPVASNCGLQPVASYFSGHHAVIRWGMSTPQEFLILNGSTAKLLRFSGEGFSISAAEPVNDISSISKMVERRITEQISKTKATPDRYQILNEKDVSGFHIVHYAIFHSQSHELGTKVEVETQGCKWSWTSPYLAAVTIRLFRRQHNSYLGAVMYSQGADGESPVVKVFFLNKRCC